MLMARRRTGFLSSGNVQNQNGGRHNQPFSGLIRDDKIFNTAVMWDDVIRDPRPPKPPRSLLFN